MEKTARRHLPVFCHRRCLRRSPKSSGLHLSHVLALWLARTPASPTPTVPPPPPPCSAVYIPYQCCKALLAFYFFNRRPSVEARSHDKPFLPLFFLNALLSVHAFACFIFLLLVFSFLKLAFWSCFANNRHAFVLFFVLKGVGGDDSAQRSTLSC